MDTIEVDARGDYVWLKLPGTPAGGSRRLTTHNRARHIVGDKAMSRILEHASRRGPIARQRVLAIELDPTELAAMQRRRRRNGGMVDIGFVRVI